MARGRASWEMGAVLVWMMAFALLVPSLEALSAPVCPATSSLDFVMVGLSDTCSPLDSKSRWASPRRFRRVMEVDEISLQKILNLNERNSGSYVAIFFHASWCPFSKLDMLTFVVLSSLFPNVNHVAVEESTIRPSVLSKYGVRGFPTVILLNSTTWAPFHGSKRLGSLVSFYMDVTAIKPSTPDLMLEALAELLEQRKMLKDAEVESSPFSWVRSPEKLLQQESYLALATSFLVLRLVYVLLPSLLTGTKVFWRRYMQHIGVANHREGLQAYGKQAIDIVLSYLCCIPKLCNGSNLRGGVVNARAWASKSLASISISEGKSRTSLVN